MLNVVTLSDNSFLFDCKQYSHHPPKKCPYMIVLNYIVPTQIIQCICVYLHNHCLCMKKHKIFRWFSKLLLKYAYI